MDAALECTDTLEGQGTAFKAGDTVSVHYNREVGSRRPRLGLESSNSENPMPSRTTFESPHMENVGLLAS